MSRPKPCAKCGNPHARCTAHRRDGAPCTMRPMRGQRVCRMHGGKQPAAMAAAAHRQAEAEARDAMVTYGAPIDMDPVDFVLGEVRRAAGHIAFLEAKIRSLGDDDLVWGVTRIKTGGDDRGTTEEAKPNIWLTLYADERRRGLDAARVALAAGYEERRVRIEERKGAQFGLVVQFILDKLQLTAKQESMVPDVVPAAFRMIDGAA